MAIAILQGIGGKALQSKSLRIEKDGSYTVEADEGYALEAVAIEVDTPDKKPETELDLGVITENGAREITPSEGKVFNKVAFNVQVPPQGVEQFDERLDGIISLQNGYIGVGYKESEGLEYIYGWEDYSVCGMGSCTDEVVVIRANYNDYPVTSISELHGETMKELVLPDTVKRIDWTLSYCAALEKVIFGSEFASIGGVSLSGNSNCKIYDFSRCQAIVYLELYGYPEYTSTFHGMPDDCKIIVPAHLLDEWKAATNWTVFADHIVAAETVADNSIAPSVSYETTDERLEAIEGNVPEVHNAGYDIGFEDGKKAEWSAFWDAYQIKGTRDNYQMGFAGSGWYPDTFKPKYSMYPVTLNSAFWDFGGRHTHEQEDADFVELFDKRGLVFDTSKCTNWTSAFMWARIKRLGVIDLTGAVGSLTTTFAYGEIFNIDKLIVKETTAFISNTFQNQSKLEEIRFEGVIGVNGLNLQWSTKLSKASIESVINCLSDTTSGLSVTFSKTARTNAFTDDEWAALIATKPNWTISLV